MEQRIIHACGHEQVHHLTGFASQQERKARWLRTTTCRICFMETKRSEQAETAARVNAAIAHLALPQLTGSERQVAWATTIRAGRLAAMIAGSTLDGDALNTLVTVTSAKWWIDNRDLTDTDLVAKSRLYADATDSTVDRVAVKGIAQAA